MSALPFALVGAALAGLGGKDQRLVSHLRDVLGPSRPLLFAALVSAAASSALAAFAGARIARSLSEDAALMFTAFALVAAAAELALPVRVRLPEEPTRSVGATLITLVALQMTDAARFLVLALSALLPAAILAGLGGAIGTGAVMALAASGVLAPPHVRTVARVRRIMALPVLAGAVVTALAARGLIG